MRATLNRLVVEDEGQDLAEYALLVAFTALATIAAWLAIQTALHNGYIWFDTTEQNNLAAVTPPPF